MNPAASVRLTAAPHPFKAANVDLEMPAGMTILEMIQAAQPDPVLHRFCHVEIDGIPIDPDKLHVIRPKAGHLVTVRVAPGKSKKKGGGKNPLQTVLTIAVMATAVAVSAGVLGPILGGAFAAGGIGALLGGAAIGTIGLAMMPSPQIGNLRAGRTGAAATARVADVRDSPSQFIEGARNTAQPWGVVPDVLGRHRMVPPYAALPFTSAAGSAQYLHMLFAWSPGQLAIEDYRIGETPATAYEGVEIQTLHGTPTDDPSQLTVYSHDMAEEAFSITLRQVDSWHQRTTAPDGDYIVVDLTLPQGLVWFTQQGNRQATSVVVNIRYRAVGGAFEAPTVATATFPMSWITTEGDHVRIELWGMQTSAIRHAVSWYTPARGQFEVEVGRSSADRDSVEIFDTIMWTALRRLQHGDPTNLGVPLARTAVRIRASDQLNNTVDTFNAIVHRVALDWDQGSQQWVLRATANPAAMFLHVLTGPSNRRPITTGPGIYDAIDMPRIQEWHDFCRVNSLECNMIVDFPTSVRELLKLVCGTGRASLDNIDGKWSVVIDQPRTVPVQHFTPRNSRGFRAEKLFPERPHAWRVRFNDRDHNWRASERILYDVGYELGTASRFEQHDLVGVTNSSQALHLATHQMRAQRLQPEVWDFEVDFEHLVANRGDLVLVTHDVLLVGLASGRIVSLTLGAGGEILGMVADEEMPMEEPGATYGVSVRTGFNVAATSRVTRDPEADKRTVEFAPPLDPGTVAVGDLFGFGRLGAETERAQVKRINRATDLTARLSLIPYTDALFNWAAPPDFDPGMTTLVDAPAPVIRTVYTGGAALGREVDATLVRVVVEVDPVGRLDARLDAQIRPTSTGENYRHVEVVSRPEHNIVVLGDMRVGEYWDVRVRWIFGALQPGPWAYRSGVTIEGYAIEATTLANLTVSAIGGQALLRWDPPTELDARFGGIVYFRHSILQDGGTWAGSTSIGQGVPASNQTATLPLKAGTYLARVFDTAGRPGVVASVSTKQASMHHLGLLLSFEEHPGWAGTHTGTQTGAGGTLELDGTYRPGVGGFGNLTDVAINGYYDPVTVVDLETVKRVRVTTHLIAASVAVNDLIDSRLDLIDSWQDFDGGDDQAEADAQVWVRITDQDPGMATSEWAWIDDTNWSDGTGWSDSGEGVIWKLFQRLDSAEFEARGFDFQLRMASKDPAFNIVVSELRIDFEEVL